MDAGVGAGLGSQLPESLFFGSAADDHEVDIFDGFGSPGKSADQKIQVLLRPQPPGIQEQDIRFAKTKFRPAIFALFR